MSTVLVMATDPVAQCLGGVNGEWVELHVSVQDGYTLECLVQCLVANYPPLGEITFSPAGMFVPTYRILVNGERILLQTGRRRLWKMAIASCSDASIDELELVAGLAHRAIQQMRSLD
jgi:hypothetical protein